MAGAGDKHLAVDDSVIPVGDNETDPLHDPDMEELTLQGTDDILDFDQMVLADKKDRVGSGTAVEEDLRQIFLNEMFNPQAPVAQKNADVVVFRRFQGEGVEFFLNRTSLTPPQIFHAHLLENEDLSPSRFHFSVDFISRSCFESDGFIGYSNE